jgi:8-amino-7-oxononanoate synthase
MDKFEFFEKKLKKREEKKEKRKIIPSVPLKNGRIVKNKKMLLNLSSNDYLGLSFNEKIFETGCEYALKYGNGSGASRLITGNPECFLQTEEKIAEFKKKGKALILNSGYQANISMIPALAGRHSIIFSDSLNHNSIIRGSLLSRAEFKRFAHNDLNHLEELLKKSMGKSYSTKIIITESIFSMDGDISDIDSIHELGEKYGCILVADEAHATGVAGEKGRGLAQKADIVMGTFGKGAGVFGAYTACSELMYDYLINFCEGFIFSTSLPPFTVGAISEAVNIIPQMDKERKHLKNISEKLRKGLNDHGFNTLESSTQIIPVLTETADKALKTAAFLEEKGVLGVAIRPPTVPENMSRIRLSLSSVFSEDDIDYVISVFDELRKK